MSAAYRRAHRAVRNERGPARDHVCVDCGGPAQEWSYDHKDHSEVVTEYRGMRFVHSEAVDHYQPRCVTCHRRFDAPPFRPWGVAKTPVPYVASREDRDFRDARLRGRVMFPQLATGGPESRSEALAGAPGVGRPDTPTEGL